LAGPAVNARLVVAGIVLAFAPGVDRSEEMALTLLAVLCVEFLGGLVLAFPRKSRALGLALVAGALLSLALGILFLWARINL
jgi:hypothetical protein